MTAEEAVIQALARLSEFGGSADPSRTVAYRRLGIRQQQLYARAGQLDPDYPGVCVTANLQSGQADLKDMVNPLQLPESITQIEIEDIGTSAYSQGDEVHQVPLKDTDSAFPPRATVRDWVISGVGSDLDGVTSIKVHYPRVPLPLDEDDAATALEVPEPHVELLVLDATIQLLKKAVDMDPDRRAAAISVVQEEEKEALAAWDAHVARWAGSRETGFAGHGYRSGDA